MPEIEAMLRPTDLRFRAMGLTSRTIHRMIANGDVAAIDMNPDGARRRWRVPLAEYERLRREWMGRKS